MRIAISATGPTLDANVDPGFGGCHYFLVVDPVTKDFEAIDNTDDAVAGGAGISTAQLIASKGVEAVLTGSCGANAYQVLSSERIKVITGISGKVKDSVEEYALGTYSIVQQSNIADQ
jgi:predicted Fe-Mo cluster-binding NifX family protein